MRLLVFIYMFNDFTFLGNFRCLNQYIILFIAIFFSLNISNITFCYCDRPSINKYFLS